MKIKLKGTLVCLKKNNLTDLTRLKQVLLKEMKTNERKIRGQLLDLSLSMVNNRIVSISHDMAHSREIGTII